MKRNYKVIVAYIIFVILASLGIAFTQGVFGLHANSIEKDARKAHKINETWEITKSTDDKLFVMIFYGDTPEQHVFSSYVNRDGFSFGYFFRAGGGLSIDGVHMYTYENASSAIFSMNKDRVAKIELDNGVEVTKIEIDPTKPFAVVVPVNCGLVTLYADDGSIVPVISESKV